MTGVDASKPPSIPVALVKFPNHRLFPDKVPSGAVHVPLGGRVDIMLENGVRFTHGPEDSPVFVYPGDKVMIPSGLPTDIKIIVSSSTGSVAYQSKPVETAVAAPARASRRVIGWIKPVEANLKLERPGGEPQSLTQGVAYALAPGDKVINKPGNTWASFELFDHDTTYVQPNEIFLVRDPHPKPKPEHEASGTPANELTREPQPGKAARAFTRGSNVAGTLGALQPPSPAKG